MVACVSVYGRKWPISQLAVRVRLYFLPVTSKAVYWIWDAKKLSYERRQTHEWINLQLNCVRLKSWWYSRCSNITAWTFFSKWQDHVVEQSFRRTFNAKPWFSRKTSRSVMVKFIIFWRRWWISQHREKRTWGGERALKSDPEFEKKFSKFSSFPRIFRDFRSNRKMPTTSMNHEYDS